MSRPHDSFEATRELARVGAAAFPDVATLAPMHLRAIDEALRATPVSARTARRATSAWGSRRAALVLGAAALVAVPSMALAGALPASVQHAAARAARVVGVALPDPASATARDATANRGSGDDAITDSRGRPDDSRPGATGNGLGTDTRRTVPGRPRPGEQRGNRFGQVEGGPDQGKAGDAQATRRPTAPSRPATSQRPGSPPGQSADHRSTSSPTPATSPAPAHSSAGGNRGGGGGAPDGAGRGGSGD